jgi:hypothetical protein
MVRQSFGEDLDPALVITRQVRWLGGVPVLECRGGQRGARPSADNQHRGLGLCRVGLAMVADVDAQHRSRRCVDLLAADQEPRPTRHDDVELLVAAGVRTELVVGFDDLLADLDAGVRVCAERTTRERDGEVKPARPA